MYKRILVPTDVSAQSSRALVSALELARKFDAEVELFHVTFSPLAYLGYGITYGLFITEEEIEKNGKAALEAALSGIEVGNVRLTTKQVSGNPAGAILEEIERDFDLVVMGSRGHGPFTGAVIGSVTQRVLAHSACPVLIVK